MLTKRQYWACVRNIFWHNILINPSFPTNGSVVYLNAYAVVYIYVYIYV